MDKPIVSVMFMSYNHGEYIKEALDSVLAQTYENIEVIISDDASNDNTMDVLREVRDSRVIIHRFDENQGASLNHMYIWTQCRGKYLALINSDDVWEREHLEKSVTYLEDNEKCGAVFSWASLIDENGKIIDPCCDVFKQKNRTQAEWIAKMFFDGNCLCHPSVVLRKEVYDTVGFYNLAMRQLPDYNMWVRMLKKYDLYVIPEVLVKHRRGKRKLINSSAPIIDNSLRDINESTYNLLHFFDDLSDELFVEAFKKQFRKTVDDATDVICEKFFLLLDDKYYMKGLGRQVAFFYFLGNCNEKKVIERLKLKYEYGLSDFYHLGTQTDVLNYREIVCDEKCDDVKKNSIIGFLKKLKRTEKKE